ncbi:MAG: hypothetical protein D6677_05425 [Calditrichaeota bacterium]|nr:MAG: hypothetical protein D6677_05425 [Calditrichota bacterium]
MLYDEVVIDKTVDKESAHEFLMEATKLATSAQLDDIGDRLGQKYRMFQNILRPDAIGDLQPENIRLLMRHIFFLRRKSGLLLKGNSPEVLQKEFSLLLYGDRPVNERFNRFVTTLSGLNEPLLIALAGELLHYNEPDKYWLWTSWIYDPKTGSGALKMLMQNDVTIEGETVGDKYVAIGRATSAIHQAGMTEGFSRLASGLTGTNIFMACVYAVYMYTVFKVKLSKEFNRILPDLPELARRVLGVQKMEISAYDS